MTVNIDIYFRGGPPPPPRHFNFFNYRIIKFRGDVIFFILKILSVILLFIFFEFALDLHGIENIIKVLGAINLS